MSVLAKKGQVVVTLQGTIGRVAILQYDAYIDCAFNGDIMTITEAEQHVENEDF